MLLSPFLYTCFSGIFLLPKYNSYELCIQQASGMISSSLDSQILNSIGYDARQVLVF